MYSFLFAREVCRVEEKKKKRLVEARLQKEKISIRRQKTAKTKTERRGREELSFLQTLPPLASQKKKRERKRTGETQKRKKTREMMKTASNG